MTDPSHFHMLFWPFECTTSCPLSIWPSRVPMRWLAVMPRTTHHQRRFVIPSEVTRHVSFLDHCLVSFVAPWNGARTRSVLLYSSIAQSINQSIKHNLYYCSRVPNLLCGTRFVLLVCLCVWGCCCEKVVIASLSWVKNQVARRRYFNNGSSLFLSTAEK